MTQPTHYLDAIPERPPSFNGVNDDGVAQAMHRIAYHDSIATHLLAQAPRQLALTRAGVTTAFEAVDDATQASKRHLPYRAYKCIDDGVVHLMTMRSELSVQPIPQVFLQTRRWALLSSLTPEIKHPSRDAFGASLICIAMDWQKTSSPSGNDVDEIPILLRDVVRHDSPWPWMTDTQLVDLLIKVVAEMDVLPPSLYFAATLNSILLTNPSQLGTTKPLSFRLCPFAMGMVRELPAGVFKYHLARRSMAQLVLHLVTRLEDLDSPLLKKRLMQALTRSPGLVTAFFDLWGASKQHQHIVTASNQSTTTTPSIAPDAKMVGISPSLRVFSWVRCKAPLQHRKFTLEHVPGLLSAIQCHDSPMIHSAAVDGLWRFILEATKPQLAEAIGIIAQCIASLVPSERATKLVNPASSLRSASWILRMNIIDRVLFETERSGDYSRLRALQQSLLETGIGQQLGGTIMAQNDVKFTLKVLMPMVRVTTLVSFRNPIFGMRLVFDNNVRKMSRMCFDAEPKGDIHPTDVTRFVSMMLVISDFMKWCGASSTAAAAAAEHAAIDERLLALWNSLDDDTFLSYALPCWTQATSNATTAAIVSQLESAFYRCVKTFIRISDKDEQEVMKKKLMYILDWLVALAWNAPEQVSSASYQTLYTSHFLGLIFRNPAQSVFFESSTRNMTRLLNEEDERDKDESVLLPHAIKTMPLVSVPETTSLAIASSSATHHRPNMEDNDSDLLLTQQDNVLTRGECYQFDSHSSTETRLPAKRHPHFPDAVEVPWTSSAENIESSIEFIDTMTPDNPEGLSQRLHTFKFAVVPRNLYGFVTYHQDECVSAHYVPTPRDHGAPASKDSVFFNLPRHRNDLIYYQNVAGIPSVAPPPEGIDPLQANIKGKYNNIRSLMPKEMYAIHSGYKRFEPITLMASSHRLCHTRAPTMQGTTGMMDVRIADAGETNDIVIGVTWNLEADSTSTTTMPGRTPHSIGIAAATGHVSFLDKDGKRNKLPYTVPFNTASRLCIGIAYNKIYFVLDNVFYPPIPDVVIPDGCDVFGLVRIGCSGVRLMTRALTNCWRLDKRRSDGSLKDVKTNPVAHNLYLAALRTKVCPHYHAHQRPQEARPHLTDLVKGSADYGALPDEARDLVDLVHLAGMTCTFDKCSAPTHVKDKIRRIIDASRAASPNA